MAGEEIEGYTKVVQKEYNKAFHEFQDARISNANVRFSTKHTVAAEEAGAYGAIIATITIPAGQQLRLIYLNFWSKDPDHPLENLSARQFRTLANSATASSFTFTALETMVLSFRWSTPMLFQ